MKAWKITQRLHLTQGQNWIRHNEGRTIQCASWDVLLWQIWSASVLRQLKRATFSCQNKPSSYRTEPARRSESKNKQRVSVLLAGLNDVECRKTVWCEGKQLESNLAGASDSKRCWCREAGGLCVEAGFTWDCVRWKCSRWQTVNLVIKNAQDFYSLNLFLTAMSLRWSQRTSWASAPWVNLCLSTQNQVRYCWNPNWTNSTKFSTTAVAYCY